MVLGMNFRIRAGAAFFVLCFLAVGCGVAPKTVSPPVRASRPGISGKVHGGQQPVVGSKVYLYAVSTTYGGNSISLLKTPGFVLTDATGGFSITDDYSCPAGSYVYLLAVGGNPGLLDVTNSSIALGAGVGLCSSLTSGTYLTVNEVTTVTMTSALAAIASSETQIGSSSDVSALFAHISVLNDVTYGTAKASDNNAVIPTAAINTLADAIASCVNSNGTGAPCSTLFSAAEVLPGKMTPVDTFQAALNIAQNPFRNVGDIYSLATPNAVFAPTLPAAPTGWNVGAINLTGNELIAADANTYIVVTTKGNMTIELRPDVAPKNVANFLSYLNNGSYTKSIIHRAIPNFIVQGGGYKYNSSGQIDAIAVGAPVVSEPRLSNLRGTIAMALAGGPDTATDQFFFNVLDNPSLDTQSGGYTVIGQLANVADASISYNVGSNGSLLTIDAIQNDTIVNAGYPFDSLPVINYGAGAPIQPDNLEYITSITPMTNVATTPAVPLFYPDATYTSEKSVTISDTTKGAVIEYAICQAVTYDPTGQTPPSPSDCTPLTVYTGGPINFGTYAGILTYATAPGYPNPSHGNIIVYVPAN
jgi:cyclophilin family peptidyl-prolyl cis-trans isomerase